MGSPIFLIVPWPSIPLCSASGFSGLVAPGVCGFPLSRCSPIELWDSLSTYIHPGIACLASQSSDWLGALWASLSGIQSSVTFVRFNVIGCCQGGTFNCPASTCWLINCALAHQYVLEINLEEHFPHTG